MRVWENRFYYHHHHHHHRRRRCRGRRRCRQRPCRHHHHHHPNPYNSLSVFIDTEHDRSRPICNLNIAFT